MSIRTFKERCLNTAWASTMFVIAVFQAILKREHCTAT